MSLVPSKRVDRIFPVIPPLCLLASVQLRGRLHRVTIAGMALSILIAGGYSGERIWSGYRDQRDALVKFGANVRAEAAAHEWRYEIVNAPDEGLLLYCDKLQFVRRDAAMEQWSRKEIDALVVARDDASDFMARFSDAMLTQVRTAEHKGGARDYVLIVRR
jgi:hypothetical protein